MNQNKNKITINTLIISSLFSANWVFSETNVKPSWSQGLPKRERKLERPNINNFKSEYRKSLELNIKSPKFKAPFNELDKQNAGKKFKSDTVKNLKYHSNKSLSNLINEIDRPEQL